MCTFHHHHHQIVGAAYLMSPPQLYDVVTNWEVFVFYRFHEAVDFGFEFQERQLIVAVSHVDGKRVKVSWKAFQYHCDNESIIHCLSGISQDC